MKSKYIFFILLSFYLFSLHVRAQIHFEGNLNSSLYAWEMAEDNNQMDFYQGVQLRIFPEAYSNFEFRSNFRFAKRGDPAEWNEKVYNSYLKWKSSDRQYEMKLGRQFIYHGVMNGTVDGLLVSTKATNSLTFKVLAGVPAPVDRQLKLTNWSDGSVLGGFTSYRFLGNWKANLSYFQKTANEETVWQQMGTALSGKIINDFYFMAKIGYNLKSSEYQNMRYRVTYYKDKWTISGEFNSQKPRVLEDSFFKIFEIEAHNQVRASIAYQFGEYRFRIRNLYTMYEDDNSNQVQFSVASRWGLVGIVYQNGFAGDNTGFFGELRYDVVSNVSIIVYSSYYNFQRHSTEIGEEALAFSGKVEYRPLKYLHLQVEVQESQNSYYKNELRGLFRLNYMFNHTL